MIIGFIGSDFMRENKGTLMAAWLINGKGLPLKKLVAEISELTEFAAKDDPIQPDGDSDVDNPEPDKDPKKSPVQRVRRKPTRRFAKWLIEKTGVAVTTILFASALGTGVTQFIDKIEKRVATACSRNCR